MSIGDQERIRDQVIVVQPLWEGDYVSVHGLAYADHEGGVHVRQFASRRGTKHRPDPVTAETVGMYVDGVTILAFTPGRRRLLITKEFRPAAGRFVYGLPSGFIEPGETTSEAAERELSEETGIENARMRRVMPAGYSNPGMSDTRSAFVTFEIPEDVKLRPRVTPHENITPMLVTPDELRGIIDDGPAVMMLQAISMTWTPDAGSRPADAGTERKEST